jgi:hypothetical protein
MSPSNRNSAELIRIDADDPDIEYIGGNHDVFWKGKPFSGVMFEMEDGQIISETTYVDGAEDGPEKTWYLNGQLEYVGENKLNLGHGPYKAWYQSGQLQREGLFEWGYIIWCREWDEEGNLTSEYKIEDNPVELERFRGFKSWHERNNIS